MGSVTTAWFDKVKMTIEWDLVDRARVAKLGRCLEADLDGVAEALGKQLVKFKGAQQLLANVRFTQRLHDVLHEWLSGLLGGAFDEQFFHARRELVQKLMEIDLAFEDIVLLQSLARGRLFELSQSVLDESPEAIWATIQALEKALCLDLMLIHAGYGEIRDAEMERALLNRFLAITGFSRTLYENLAEAREWSEVGVQ